MLNRLIIAAACGFALFYSCRPPEVKKDAVIDFETTEINLVELKLDDEAIGLFKFSNPGTSPLVIEKVETSCGCTVPKWPQKPILPGKHGEIKVRYDTSQPGMFSKTIIVYYNGENSPAKLWECFIHMGKS